MQFNLSLSPINITAALCSAKAYNSAYAKGEQMINETMYARGAESSIIREIFSYGLERKAQIGAENVFDFSLGNPSVPAPLPWRNPLRRPWSCRVTSCTATPPHRACRNVEQPLPNRSTAALARAMRARMSL